MKRTALITALMLFTALPVMAQPIEAEVLPPVQMAPQPSSPAPSQIAPAPAQPAKKKNESGYLPMGTAGPEDAPTPPIAPLNPADTASPSSVSSDAPAAAAGSDNGMAGVSGGTSAYDLGAPTSAPPQDITPSAPAAAPAGNPPNELLRDATPIRNWQENMDKSTRGDDPNLANKKFCNLKVSFTSIGTGIDGKTNDKVRMYLTANPDILSFTEHRWGKEGEVDYCVTIREHKNRAKIYSDLKRQLPPKAANAPPTNMFGDGFEPVSTYR